MALPKRHWGNAAQSPGFVPDAACGRSGVREIITTSARAFVSVSRNTTWYCSDCAKAARLALAKESAPKPSDVIWPKPRPIAEAPRTTILAWFPGTDMFNEGWEIVFPSDEGWITGREGHQPTHFLPLPPEVQTP